MPGTQNGAALILGLMLLVSMSALAITAASGAALQNRMAHNWEARSTTYSAAAIADREARAWLASRPPTDRGEACGTSSVQPFAVHARGSLPAQPEYLGEHWWANNAMPANRHPELATALIGGGDVPGQAAWLIEEIHCQSPAPSESHLVAWYRILSRAQGRLPGTIVVTESIVARPWGVDVTPADYPGSRGMSAFCQQFDNATACGRKAWRQRR